MINMQVDYVQTDTGGYIHTYTYTCPFCGKPVGWKCPVCGRGLAPWVRECDCIDRKGQDAPFNSDGLDGENIVKCEKELDK